MSTSKNPLRSFANAFSTGLTVWMERQSRNDQVAKLQAKSDDELARLGISRDRIIHHVYRDIFVL